MAEQFSIIVTVYNREHLVLRTLDSIKAQTYRPLHLIVVDNASTDDSLAAVTAWGRRHADESLSVSIVTESRQGATNARNRGLEEVTGDKLMFFDSDDTMHPELVEAVMKTFAANPGADIVHWKKRIHDLHGRSWVPHYSTSGYLRNHIFHALLSTQTFAATRRLVMNAGAWTPGLPVWNDWELGLRLLLCNPRIVSLPRVLVDVYMQRESITGTSFKSKAGKWENTLDLAQEIIERSGRDDLASLTRLLDLRRVVLAAHYKREGDRKLARKLLNATLSKFDGTALQRHLLHLAYAYTAAGGRGVATIFGSFL